MLGERPSRRPRRPVEVSQLTWDFAPARGTLVCRGGRRRGWHLVRVACSPSSWRRAEPRLIRWPGSLVVGRLYVPAEGWDAPWTRHFALTIPYRSRPPRLRPLTLRAGRYPGHPVSIKAQLNPAGSWADLFKINFCTWRACSSAPPTSCPQPLRTRGGEFRGHYPLSHQPVRTHAQGLTDQVSQADRSS
jgi:hypothetical protein